MPELEAVLPSFAGVLGETAGLAFPRSRHSLLRRAIEQRLVATSSRSVESYLELLADDSDERRHLLELATIGETYFFRHPEQLQALREQAIEPLVAERRRRGNRSLRLWSAGCASGAETYSAAILVAETLEGRGEWDVRIVGTDVSEGALHRARAGRYGPWSVRSALGEREAWFTTHGRQRQVTDALRHMVRFEHHNLVADLPFLPKGLGGPPDIVLCRNVLMYFEPHAVRRVVEGLFEALAPGGWLVVAPVEASIPALRRFELHADERATLYRRPDAAAHPKPRSITPKRTERAAEPPPTTPRPAATVGRPLPAVVHAERTVGLAEVSALAEGGRIDEARAQCDRLLQREPSVEGFLLLATLAEATDDLEAASAALRRACYLDAGHVGAQFRLGLVEWRRGAVRPARARLRRALELAKSHADDDPIPSVQLSAGRLRAVAGTMIR